MRTVFAKACQLTFCNRAAKRTSPYCSAHQQRIDRGKTGTALAKPFQKRGPRRRIDKTGRRELLDEVATICDFWANHYMSPEVREMAALFRRLE